MSEAVVPKLIIQEQGVMQKDLFLTFHVGKEVYGIEIFHVIEIVRIPKITNVPEMPDSIKGVVNLRDSIIPVMDVRLRFGMPEREYDERSCLIVVKVNKATTGLIVDRVNEVVEIPVGQIEPPPQNNKFTQCYLSGIGKTGDSVNILLNLSALLGNEDQEELGG